MARFERALAQPGDGEEEHREHERKPKPDCHGSQRDAGHEPRPCPPSPAFFVCRCARGARRHVHRLSASISSTAATISSGSKGFTITTSAPPSSATGAATNEERGGW